jgi:hypothetical protein
MTTTPVPDDERLAFIDGDDAVEDDLQAIPADANEADVIEQHQELPDDEEDAAPASGS